MDDNKTTYDELCEECILNDTCNVKEIIDCLDHDILKCNDYIEK